MARPPIATCYGIDASGNRINVVRVTRKGGRMVTEDKSLAIPPGDDPFAARMRQELAAGRAVPVTVLPSHESFSRRLAAPFASTSKARRVLPSLLDVQLPVPLEQCVALYADLAVGASGRAEAMALAARKDDIRAHLARFAAAGIDPVCIDAEPLALWQASRAEIPVPSGRTRVVLHLSPNATAVIVGRDDRLLAAHGLRLGLTTTGPDSPDARTYAARLQQAFRSVGVDASAEIALSGPSASKQTAALLRQLLGLGDDAPMIVHKDAEFLLARSIAQRFLRGDSADHNFRQGESQHDWVARTSTQSDRSVVIAALAAGLLLIVGSIAATAWVDQRVNGLQARVGGLARELSGSPRVPRGQEVLVAERALNERASSLRPLVQYADASKALLVDLVLRYASEFDMTVENLSIKRNEVSLRGDASAWENCEKLAGLLKEKGWTVTLDRGGDDGRGRVAYTLRGTS